MIYLELLLAFMQIGLFSIGGGYAAMPLIQHQAIEVHSWLTMSEFADIMTISEMTPGPIAINSATFVGIQVAGIPGALAATIGCILPSCFIVTFLAFIYYKARGLSSIQGILKGIRPAVIAMIASAALCGAVLGFLPFNANRATIFMGDAGSMFIGYVMACISVFGLFKAQALFSIVVPALIFALPILDTMLAFFRRIAKGQSPFKADRSHLHHKLIDSGFTPKQSVIVIYCASAVFCVASILFMKYKILSGVLVLADLVLLEIFKHWRWFFGGKEKPSPQKASAENAEKSG